MLENRVPSKVWEAIWDGVAEQLLTDYAGVRSYLEFAGTPGAGLPMLARMPIVILAMPVKLVTGLSGYNMQKLRKLAEQSQTSWLKLVQRAAGELHEYGVGVTLAKEYDGVYGGEGVRERRFARQAGHMQTVGLRFEVAPMPEAVGTRTAVVHATPMIITSTQ